MRRPRQPRHRWASSLRCVNAGRPWNCWPPRPPRPRPGPAGWCCSAGPPARAAPPSWRPPPSRRRHGHAGPAGPLLAGGPAALRRRAPNSSPRRRSRTACRASPGRRRPPRRPEACRATVADSSARSRPSPRCLWPWTTCTSPTALPPLARRGRPADRPAAGPAGGDRAQPVRHRPAGGRARPRPLPALVRTHALGPLSPDGGRSWSVRTSATPRRTGSSCVRAGAAKARCCCAPCSTTSGPRPRALPAPVPDTCARCIRAPTRPRSRGGWTARAGQPPGRPRPRRTRRRRHQDRHGPADLLARTADADPARVAGWLTAMTGWACCAPTPRGGPATPSPCCGTRCSTAGPARPAGAPTVGRPRRCCAAATAPRRWPDNCCGSGPVGEAWAPAPCSTPRPSPSGTPRTDDALAYLRRALDEPMPADRRRRAHRTGLPGVRHRPLHRPAYPGSPRRCACPARRGTGCARPSPSARPSPGGARRAPPSTYCAARTSICTPRTD